MSSAYHIRYILQQEIDKVKWDAAISRASNGLLYGTSFYLDHMAKQWDGLVLNDYEAVMPLTWNKKYGIYYLYQPFGCACLGVFGNALTAAATDAFLQAIPARFRYIDISLNYKNLHNNTHFPGLYERKNYVLPLHEPYHILYSRFSDNVKRNIKRAAQHDCLIKKPSLTDVIHLAKIQLKQFAVGTNEDLANLAALYHFLEQKSAAVTYGITAVDGRLMASCIFFIWQKRAYYILVGNHADSKSTGASHALINAFIKEHAGTDLILDFEGSDITTLALFYSSFGATEENYAAVKYNRLPVLLRWLKR